jgi:hypothetical protein
MFTHRNGEDYVMVEWRDGREEKLSPEEYERLSLRFLDSGSDFTQVPCCWQSPLRVKGNAKTGMVTLVWEEPKALVLGPKSVGSFDERLSVGSVYGSYGSWSA